MPITFKCSGCGKEYTVADSLAGRKGKCKVCGAPTVIPAAKGGRRILCLRRSPLLGGRHILKQSLHHRPRRMRKSRLSLTMNSREPSPGCELQHHHGPTGAKGF